MSLFSSIKSILQEKPFVSKVDKITNLALTAITHPVGFITNTQKAYEVTSKESTTQLVVGGASNALLVTAPFSGAVKTAVTKTIASTIAKAPIKSAAVGLIGGGALISSPTIAKTAVNVVSSAPESLVGTGETIGKIVESGGNILTDLSSKDVKNIGTALGAGVLLGGAGALAYDYFNNKKSEDKAIDTNTVVTPTKETDTTSLGTPSVAPLRETQTITSSGSRKRRKGSKKQAPTIRINNAIAISNTTNGIKVQNKRYLKEYAY